MSVKEIREASGGTEWTISLPGVAAGRGFGSLPGPGRLSLICLERRDSGFSSDHLDARRIGARATDIPVGGVSVEVPPCFGGE